MKKALLAVSILLLTGWQLQSAAVIAKPASTPQPALQPKAQINKPQVEVLSPGAEPRQELRFRPAVKAQQQATMTMNLDMTLSLGGNPRPATKVPATIMKFATTVTKIDPNGDIHYQFRYTDVDVASDAGVSPSVLRQMRSQLEKIKGLSGSVVVNDRGETISGNFAVPKNADATTRQMVNQLSQSIDQFSAPVPAAAVGVGAKWRVVTTPTMNGIKLQQTATYELVQLQKGVATLNVAVEQQASPQAVSFPGLPTGSKLMLKSLNGQGQGQTKLRFDQLIPLDAKIAMRSNSEMAATNPASNQPITIGTDTKMNIVLVAR
jgi:Family of unknown function (DUF6263)